MLGEMTLPWAVKVRAIYSLALLHFVLGSKLASSRPLGLPDWWPSSPVSLLCLSGAQHQLWMQPSILITVNGLLWSMTVVLGATG